MKKEQERNKIEKKLPRKQAKIKLINPERKPLTPGKLRELSGRHDLTDERAEEIIHSIRLLVKILYRFVKKKETTCIDNQQVVNLNTTNHDNQKRAA